MERPMNRAVSSMPVLLSSHGSHSFKCERLRSISRVRSSASSSPIWRNSIDSLTRNLTRYMRRSIRAYTQKMEVRRLAEHIRQREDQLFLVLTLIIGAIVGLTVVAFIVVTERIGLRLYPAYGAPWRRLVTPVIGALGTGYLLYRYFPNARGSGIPQTKTALFAGSGKITLQTVIGKF